MIRVMVVDDEQLSHEELKLLIAEDPQFQVLEEAENGIEALEKIKQAAVDVIFLDIEMPGLNGLEVAGRLAEWDHPPLVVFATAYNEYAIPAFEAHAIDYLLKPYDPERLKKTLIRIKETLKNKIPSKQKLMSLENYLIQKGILKKLVGHRRSSKERIVIEPAQVYYFYAKLSEVFAYLADEELIINITLKDLVANLDPIQFAQTHKAYIVNLDKIEKVSPMFSGNFEITLKAPKRSTIPLSRRYAKNLKGLLGSW